MKPKVFVGSSVANLRWAHLIQKELYHDAEVTVWPQGVFSPMDYPLESLFEVLDATDFGVFVCTPEDVTTQRKKSKKIVRDNVIFELGLYLGRYGRDRAFILVPEEAEGGFLPTDLIGLTPLKFRTANGAKQSTVGPACSDIRTAMEDVGRRDLKFIDPQTLETFAIAVDDLKTLLDNDQFLALSGKDRLGMAYNKAHQFAQSMADREWPGHAVVVSLKTPDPVNPEEFLTCHYLRERLPPRRLKGRRMSPMPPNIPMKGSIAGAAFQGKRTITVETLSDACLAKLGLKMDKQLRAEIDGIVGSIVASPIELRGVVVGVAKLDIDIAGFFRPGDRRVDAVVRAITGCFELAFRVGAVGNTELMITESAEQKLSNLKRKVSK